MKKKGEGEVGLGQGNEHGKVATNGCDSGEGTGHDNGNNSGHCVCSVQRE